MTNKKVSTKVKQPTTVMKFLTVSAIESNFTHATFERSYLRIETPSK